VVIHVYSTALTVPGDVSLGDVTHLEQLPKTLTSADSRQVRGILTGRGLPKSSRFPTRCEQELSGPEFPHLKKILPIFVTGILQTAPTRVIEGLGARVG